MLCFVLGQSTDKATSISNFLISGQPHQFRAASVSSSSAYSQSYFMPNGNVVPQTPQMPPRKRRATDNNVAQSQEMSSMSTEAASHATSALPSTITHFSVNPFSPLPSGFSPAFSFSPLLTTAKLNSHDASSSAADQSYDPTFSIPAPSDFPMADSSGASASDAPASDALIHGAGIISSATLTMSQDQSGSSGSGGGTTSQQQLTPTESGSVHTDPDKDPFLSLLEQLAENEQSRGGPSELDFFLSAAAQ